MIGITLLENREIGKFSFHVFDRDAIHIQVCGDLLNKKIHNFDSRIMDYLEKNKDLGLHKIREIK